MQSDEPKRECHQGAEEHPRTLSRFWSSQLERIKERAERQVNRKSSPYKHNGHLRLNSDGAHRN
jgi:hypothetical protein